MTIRKASFETANSHPAEDLRLSLTANMLQTTGITSFGSLAVTANGTPNMSVNVAAGGAYVPGTQTSTQGPYGVYSDATVNLAISAANPTNPRIDRVVMLVDDQGGGYGAPTGAGTTTANAAQLIVVAGTPAASPSAPAIPQNSISLATIAVAANATSIVSGNITDTRTWASTIGGAVLCTSTSRPSSPYRGMTIVESDTGNELVYYGATTGWRPAWGQPWGVIFEGQLTSNVTSITTTDTLLVSSGAIAMLVNRKLRLSYGVKQTSTVGADLLGLTLKNGMTAISGQFLFECYNSGHQAGGVARYSVPSSGNYTFNLYAQRVVGSGSLTAYGDNSGNSPTFLIVEDMGPATSTAPTS